MSIPSSRVIFSALISMLLASPLLLQAQRGAGADPFAAWEERYKNGIAAIVEDRVITMENIREKLEPIIPQIARESRNAAEFQMRVDQLGREILQNEIDRVLIVKEYEEQEKLRIPRSIVENEFDNRLNGDFDGDRSRLLEYLRSQNKTMRDYRREITEEIIVMVMRQQQRRTEAEISPEKIEDFYYQNKIRFYQEESIRMRQILLTPYANEGQEVLLQNARNIITQLERGASFSALARAHSQDEMAQRGGDWGWINRSDIRDEIAQIAFDLQTGEWSEPLTLDGAVLILYAQERREEGIQPLPEVRERIEGFLMSQIAREGQDEWLERLRSDGYIKYFL